MSFCVIIVSVLFLAVLSIIYDFGKCHYPSRELPYFVSGRLILGVLLPFLVIYLDGLERVCYRLSKKINPLIVLVIIVALITYSELALTINVFASQYNWFHLG